MFDEHRERNETKNSRNVYKSIYSLNIEFYRMSPGRKAFRAVAT